MNCLGLGTQAGAYGQPGGLKTVAYLEASELEYTSSLSSTGGRDGAAAAGFEFEIMIGPVTSGLGGIGF